MLHMEAPKKCLDNNSVCERTLVGPGQFAQFELTILPSMMILWQILAGALCIVFVKNVSPGVVSNMKKTQVTIKAWIWRRTVMAFTAGPSLILSPYLKHGKEGENMTKTFTQQCKTKRLFSACISVFFPNQPSITNFEGILPRHSFPPAPSTWMSSGPNPKRAAFRPWKVPRTWGGCQKQ